MDSKPALKGKKEEEEKGKEEKKEERKKPATKPWQQQQSKKDTATTKHNVPALGSGSQQNTKNKPAANQPQPIPITPAPVAGLDLSSPPASGAESSGISSSPKVNWPKITTSPGSPKIDGEKGEKTIEKVVKSSGTGAVKVLKISDTEDSGATGASADVSSPNQEVVPSTFTIGSSPNTSDESLNKQEPSKAARKTREDTKGKSDENQEKPGEKPVEEVKEKVTEKNKESLKAQENTRIRSPFSQLRPRLPAPLKTSTQMPQAAATQMEDDFDLPVILDPKTPGKTLMVEELQKEEQGVNSIKKSASQPLLNGHLRPGKQNGRAPSPSQTAAVAALGKSLGDHPVS